MSLNFFKTETKKTDASLPFQTILDNLNTHEEPIVLDVDTFVQQEHIDLGQHQVFYKENDHSIGKAPTHINKQDQRNEKETRSLVNALIETAQSMPDMESNTIEYEAKVSKALRQNNDTIQKIKSIDTTL